MYNTEKPAVGGPVLPLRSTSSHGDTNSDVDCVRDNSVHVDDTPSPAWSLHSLYDTETMVMVLLSNETEDPLEFADYGGDTGVYNLTFDNEDHIDPLRRVVAGQPVQLYIITARPEQSRDAEDTQLDGTIVDWVEVSSQGLSWPAFRDWVAERGYTVGSIATEDQPPEHIEHDMQLT